MIAKDFCLGMCAIVVTGCAANITPLATGGSKADGVVVMSYRLGVFRKAVIDYDATLAIAIDKCQKWGYESAEAFGGATRECKGVSDYGGDGEPSCTNHLYEITYQCLDTPTGDTTNGVD